MQVIQAFENYQVVEADTAEKGENTFSQRPRWIKVGFVSFLGFRVPIVITILCVVLTTM